MFGGWFGGSKEEEEHDKRGTSKNDRPARSHLETEDSSLSTEHGTGGWWSGFGTKAEKAPEPRQESGGAVNTIRNLLPGTATEEARAPALPGWSNPLTLEANTICPSLTIKQRLQGFLVCLAIGALISIGNSLRLFRIAAGDVDSVAFWMSMGNIVSMTGTLFLLGPTSQCQRMFEPSRWMWSALFLTTMILTLVLSFTAPFSGRALLILFMMVVQYVALLWYTLSYIPFGHRLFQEIVKGFCNRGS